MIEIAIILACLLIAFSVGTNDTSNSFGVCIGCGLISFKRAILLLLIFVLIGVNLQGRVVMKTVGELTSLSVRSLAVSLFVSSLVIVSSNLKRFPISSHQVIVCSLMGSALALGLEVDYYTFFKIVLSWMISPISSLFMAIAIYFIIERTLVKYSVFAVEKMLSALLMLSAFIIAYNTGANELATAIGAVVHYGLIEPIYVSILGSFSLFIGAITLSYRVIETVGKGITALDVISGFSAQFGAGLSVWLFTTFGMPISTTYCIVGGVFGVGIYKGIGTVSKDLMKKIVFSWIVSPITGFLLAFILSLISSL